MVSSFGDTLKLPVSRLSGKQIFILTLFSEIVINVQLSKNNSQSHYILKIKAHCSKELN